MEGLVKESIARFSKYVESFKELNESQKRNFEIKKEHSVRVAEIAVYLAEKLKWNEDEVKLAFLAGLFHDVGRFQQLIEFNTLNDEKSVDHAEYSVKVIESESFLNELNEEEKKCILLAISNHNKFQIQNGIGENQLQLSRLLRDADKLDIYKVLTDFYLNRNKQPNHTLTWELPKGSSVSPEVAKEVLAGKLVSKKNVVSEIDVKIMQLSWVYDLNFRPSVEYVFKHRFLEGIYNSLPKNDKIIEVYRKIKVFSENKLLQ